MKTPTARRWRRAWLAIGLWTCATLLPGPEPSHADASALAVIAHPTAGIAQLSLIELKAIFAVDQRYFASGEAAIPFNAPSHSELRTRFDAAVFGLDPESMGKFWIDRRIRGKARPPRQVQNEQLIARVVRSLPGAIAYVPEDAPLGDVVVVARIEDGRVLPPRGRRAP